MMYGLAFGPYSQCPICGRMMDVAVDTGTLICPCGKRLPNALKLYSEHDKRYNGAKI